MIDQTNMQCICSAVFHSVVVGAESIERAEPLQGAASAYKGPSAGCTAVVALVSHTTPAAPSALHACCYCGWCGYCGLSILSLVVTPTQGFGWIILQLASAAVQAAVGRPACSHVAY